MNLNKTRYILILIITFIVAFTNPLKAQEKKVAPTSQQLFIEIANMDSILFEAFNTQNMPEFKPLFTKDLEWFQDNDGLLTYEKVFHNFDIMFHKEFKLTRELVKGSLEVHPIKDYGAIETGVHKFHHIENGKEETGTFKFLMIWQKKDGQWKISKVISYDH